MIGKKAGHHENAHEIILVMCFVEQQSRKTYQKNKVHFYLQPGDHQSIFPLMNDDADVKHKE